MIWWQLLLGISHFVHIWDAFLSPTGWNRSYHGLWLWRWIYESYCVPYVGADTTPPKKPIKNLQENMMDASFTPGANVHFSFQPSQGAYFTYHLKSLSISCIICIIHVICASTDRLCSSCLVFLWSSRWVLSNHASHWPHPSVLLNITKYTEGLQWCCVWHVCWQSSSFGTQRGPLSSAWSARIARLTYIAETCWQWR